MKKNYNIIIEKGKDGIYVGSIPNLPGCHSDGKTIDELLKNITEAIKLWEEVHHEKPNYLELVGIQTLKI